MGIHVLKCHIGCSQDNIVCHNVLVKCWKVLNVTWTTVMLVNKIFKGDLSSHPLTSTYTWYSPGNEDEAAGRGVLPHTGWVTAAQTVCVRHPPPRFVHTAITMTKIQPIIYENSHYQHHHHYHHHNHLNQFSLSSSSFSSSSASSSLSSSPS